MMWAAGAVILVLGCALFVYRTGKQGLQANLRVTATVFIPESGSTTITFLPATPSAEDLSRMLLVYGSKLRWLLLNEPEEIQDLFKELTGETVDEWFRGAGPLLERLSLTSGILDELMCHDATVPGGEKFVLRYARTPIGSSAITNDLPRPGLAPNIPLHFVLLVSVVYDSIQGPDRERAGTAYRFWRDMAFNEWTPDKSFAGLARLVAHADAAWGHASA